VNGRNPDAAYWRVAPESVTGIVGAVDNATFLSDPIAETSRDLCVDPNRVHVTGNSNGAGMATVLACDARIPIAAVAPVSGINLAPVCPDQGPVSLIAFHGDADPLVEYAGGALTAIPGLETSSVPEAMDQFAAAGSCDGEPEVSMPFDDVELSRWPGCAAGLGIELHTVLGGGHMTTSVEATTLMVDFFDAHPRPD
jgi:polyhydroxybutyrate depolymerase